MKRRRQWGWGLSPQGTVPLRKSQRGYLLITVVVALFLLATIAVLLTHDSAISANTSSTELETARADYLAQAGMQHALWSAGNNACMGNMTIPATVLGLDSYTASVSGAAAGTLHTLTADQDAWIRSDDADRNNGTTASNHIKFDAGNIEQVLTRFDLSTLPANAQINSAVAWFHLKSGKTHVEGPITAHEVTADWTEAGVTWNSFAGAYRNATLGMIPAQDTGGVWVAINLTGLVQAWVNGAPNYGILMESVAEGIHTEYMAREDGTNPPRLEVVVGSGQASPVTVQATGTLANGNTRSLQRPIMSAYQPPGTVILQLGTDRGADTRIDSSKPTNNFGGANDLEVSGDPANEQRSLLKFDLGSIPAHASVRSAQLELWVELISAPGTAEVHRITRSWVEGSSSGGGTVDGTTWATYDATSPWTTAGGDFNPTAAAAAKLDSANTWVTWEIGSLVEEWLAGKPNNGLLIQGDGALRGVKFTSQDATTTLLRPKLTITYACECGSTCMAPQGAGNVLLVVADPATLLSIETLKKDLIESWGYTVNLIDDDATQTTFDVEVAANDVVYVAESVLSTSVGSKLTNASIGVVSEEGALNDELGIATAEASPVGSTINISDNSHFITQMFGTGPLDIYTVDMAGKAVAGTEAPGLQTLGDWSGAGSPVVLDTGAALGGGVGGENAAGRRVLLPIGNNIDVSKVNNNGHLIMQRAIAWGMKADAGSSRKILLVVGNAGSPASKDTDRKALLESWGYAVTLIDDGADQLTFDTETAANNVVYVTASIDGGALADKLTNSTAGIVNEFSGKLDNFGFGSQVPPNTVTANAYTSTNPAHYISEPFGGSGITHFTSNITMPVASGTLAPGIQSVAAIGAVYWALPTLDTGAARWDMTSSTGRRVHLPFGLANISQLTADGLTLMHRAIEWAATDPDGNSGKTVLLVVTDPANLTVQEDTKKLLIESWGFAVNVIDQSDPQEAFDKYVFDSDVVFVTEDVTASNVGLKLTAASIGVVTEEANLSDELGFSDSIAWGSGTDLKVDNGYYITEPLPPGQSPILTVAESLAYLTGTIAPDLRVLGESADGRALAELEAGARMRDGGIAAGRRVLLPWGGNDMDVNHLNANGLTVFKRSLEWGAQPASLGPIAHWKLDDGSGTTAIDSAGGHDGTLANGPVWVTGRLGDALNFDGNNDYVDLTSNAELDDIFIGGATVMAWIEPAGWGGNGYGRIFDKSTSASSTGDGWAIRLNKDNNGLNFGQGFSSGRGWWKIPNNSIDFGVWQHIAVAYDASSTANDPNVYLNGNPVAVTRVDAPSGDLRSDASINLRLGNHAAGTSWSFDGAIDDARIYDRMLDAAEIAEIATGGSGGGGSGGGAPAEYLDNFAAVAYNGSDGVNDWAADPWEELSESDGPTSGRLFIASDPDVAKSEGQRLVVDSRFTELKRPVDLSGFSSAWLSFNYRRDGYPTPSDYFAVLISDNGKTWTELERIYGIANDPVYRPAVYDISKFASANTEVQIVTGGINNMQTLYVDNVRVASTPLAGCAGVFADEFNVRSYANNDGTVNWAGDWTEIKENNGPTSGDIQVRAEINNYQLRVRDDGYGLWRAADLSGASQATLSLDFKRKNLDSSSDYVTVDVSSDGGSTWTELDRFQGGGSDSLYQYRYYDITGHASANTRIRFLGSSTLGGTDEVWFDDIEIVCTP